jgi:uncharacterized membrane protein YhaH (DUF805 family)
MNWAKFKNLYFTIHGRVDRKTYWIFFVLPSIVFSISIEIILEIYGADIARLALIPLVPIIVALISGWIKRLHDLNHSGWWALLTFIPFINFIFSIIYLGIVKGNLAENKYGLPNGGVNAKTYN